TLCVVTGCAKTGIVAGPPRQRRKLLGLAFAFRSVNKGPRMSSTSDSRQATMDSTQIYCEETFTDRKVGTIRRLTPVTADGLADAARPVKIVGKKKPKKKPTKTIHHHT